MTDNNNIAANARHSRNVKEVLGAVSRLLKDELERNPDRAGAVTDDPVVLAEIIAGDLSQARARLESMRSAEGLKLEEVRMALLEHALKDLQVQPYLDGVAAASTALRAYCDLVNVRQ
jgi:hypothetical protein